MFPESLSVKPYRIDPIRIMSIVFSFRNRVQSANLFLIQSPNGLRRNEQIYLVHPGQQVGFLCSPRERIDSVC
jgi:hypothetical protein